jgi:hypothetical protein
MTEIKFKVGDLVTRDGTDIHRVIEADDGSGLILVECVKEPLGFLEEDGVTRGAPWTRKGERESNLTRRYSFAGAELEGVAREPAPKLNAPDQG